MERSGYNSKRFLKDDFHELDHIVSLTVWNYGDTDLVLIVNGQRWDLPRAETGKTTPSRFVVDPDYTFSEYKLEFLLRRRWHCGIGL